MCTEVDMVCYELWTIIMQVSDVSVGAYVKVDLFFYSNLYTFIIFLFLSTVEIAPVSS